MSDRTIGAYLEGETPSEGGVLAKCPRCGYTARYFDLLAIQPNFIPLDQLRPVYKCPECKHLFALAANGEAS